MLWIISSQLFDSNCRLAFNCESTLVKIPRTKFTAFLEGVRGSLATSAQQGLQDLLADREAKRNKAFECLRAYCSELDCQRARKPLVRPKAKSKCKNKKKKQLKSAVKTEKDKEGKRDKASSALCREPYLLRPRKPIVKSKAKPKRENKEKKELKTEVLETVSAPSSYPQYVGDTSDDEDELPLCLLQLLRSSEERTQVVISSLKKQLTDDVPAQIKQAFRTCRERRWATGVLRMKQVDTSRDLD